MSNMKIRIIYSNFHVTHDLVHLIRPILATIASAAQPVLLDALIPALFLGYGAMILAATWRGSEGFARPVALWKEARA